MNNTKIAIIGAGKMGSSMLSALKPEFPLTAAYDKNTDLNTVLPEAEVLIFAVKPQNFKAACKAITVDLSKKLVISIMAGVSIKTIQAETRAEKIVRSMPNLPLQVGAGLTAWVTGKDMKNKLPVKKIFSCFGEEIELKKESAIDKITALSGSGPAYFFHLCELMAEQAELMGFNKKDAAKITESTFIGSAKLLAATKKTAKEFRETVSSKGGTTEAALKELKKNKFGPIFQKGIKAAFKRSKELNS